MTAVNKQDSNNTDLRYAVETTPGVVAGDCVWQPLEPNSYTNFGADVKTKARMPINASRQLKKGVVVDLDAQGGFIQDLTADNFQDIAQSFMYASMRRKSEYTVATVSGSHQYEPASGGTDYYAGDLLFAKGFADTANNGLKTVSGLSAAALVAVTDTATTSATAQAGTISRVGFEFGAGELTVVTGALPKIVATPVAASCVLTSTGNFSNGNTVTIGGKVYTLQDTLSNTDGHVHIGDTAAASLTNLANAINGSGGTAGTDYATATTANPYVTAVAATSTVTVTAIVAGAVGNAITTTEVGTNNTWAHVTLVTGSGGRALNSFGLIPGEFIYIGDDTSTKAFFHAANNGFARVRSVAAGYIELDKTQATMVTDDGTIDGSGGVGNTVRLYFGRVLKNESNPNLIVKRSVQIERTLGAPDDSAPTQVQAEYLVHALANELKVDMKSADIVRCEMSFLANTTHFQTGSNGVKAGSRPSLQDSDAFNSTSDVSFTKMAIVGTTSSPTPLFAFFTNLTIDLKNNLKQNKAVGVLGAFDSTPGFFQVSAAVTAYFTDVAEMQAVIANDSVTLETHMFKFNKGVTIDLPLVVLSKAMADVKINEPIMIPLASDAATAKLINQSLDHTMLWVFWDYLPTVAG